MKTQADYDAAVEYTPGARVTTSWYCGSEPEREIRYVQVQPPWWNNFLIGWVVGLVYCCFIDWLSS